MTHFSFLFSYSSTPFLRPSKHEGIIAQSRPRAWHFSSSCYGFALERRTIAYKALGGSHCRLSLFALHSSSSVASSAVSAFSLEPQRHNVRRSARSNIICVLCWHFPVRCADATDCDLLPVRTFPSLPARRVTEAPPYSRGYKDPLYLRLTVSLYRRHGFHARTEASSRFCSCGARVAPGP